MSPRLLTELREYWRTVRSPRYLFPGRTFDAPLSSTTVQKMVKAAALQAGIRNDISPHTMRHSHATGLLEAGVDLLTISHLLVGHDDGMVAFRARVGRTAGGSDETEDVRLPGLNFVRRWTLQILPHRYTKTRRFG